MTRNGKIARLPASIRDHLNRRLSDGEPGTRLVQWLNGLPLVQEVMADEFGGRPVKEQNLTEWKQGGYEDWLRHQETCAWVRAVADESAELEDEAGDFSVADWLSAPLAVALGRWVQQLEAGARDDPEQLNRLLVVAKEISLLRRQDHTQELLRLKRDRQDAEDQRRAKEKWDKIWADLEARQLLSEAYFGIRRRNYDQKRQQGSLTPADEERYQEVCAKLEEWQRERAECPRPFFPP